MIKHTIFTKTRFVIQLSLSSEFHNQSLKNVKMSSKSNNKLSDKILDMDKDPEKTTELDPEADTAELPQMGLRPGVYKCLHCEQEGLRPVMGIPIIGRDIRGACSIHPNNLPQDFELFEEIDMQDCGKELQGVIRKAQEDLEEVTQNHPWNQPEPIEA
jgi:hypothetical protein